MNFSMSSLSSVTGTVTMSRTLSTASSGTHYVIRIPANAASGSGSTAATFTDAVIIDNGLLRNIGTPKPSATTESRDLVSFDLAFLSPTSARSQTITYSSAPQASSRRIIFLPRADLLPVGTSFIFEISYEHCLHCYLSIL